MSGLCGWGGCGLDRRGKAGGLRLGAVIEGKRDRRLSHSILVFR